MVAMGMMRVPMPAEQMSLVPRGWHILSSRGRYMTVRALLQQGEETQPDKEANVQLSSTPTGLFRN